MQWWCGAIVEHAVHKNMGWSFKRLSRRASALVSAKGWQWRTKVVLFFQRGTPCSAPKPLLRSVSWCVGPLSSVAIASLPQLPGLAAPELLAGTSIGAVFPLLVDERFSARLSHTPRTAVEQVHTVFYSAERRHPIYLDCPLSCTLCSEAVRLRALPT
jgi:hypothetical protein